MAAGDMVEARAHGQGNEEPRDVSVIVNEGLREIVAYLNIRTVGALPWQIPPIQKGTDGADRLEQNAVSLQASNLEVYEDVGIVEINYPSSPFDLSVSHQKSPTTVLMKIMRILPYIDEDDKDRPGWCQQSFQRSMCLRSLWDGLALARQNTVTGSTPLDCIKENLQTLVGFKGTGKTKICGEDMATAQLAECSAAASCVAFLVKEKYLDVVDLNHNEMVKEEANLKELEKFRKHYGHISSNIKECWSTMIQKLDITVYWVFGRYHDHCPSMAMTN